MVGTIIKMIDRVQYHKQWRAKKKQSTTQSLTQCEALVSETKQLQETVVLLSKELKRFEPLLTLSDEKLNEIIKLYNDN